MRPVLLELDGFASFRTETSINFEDADYFVLVGATGSGKSTVIDAITFALYASVARWAKENVVSPALAPTATRGTVKLVFDAKGHRYIVIRDVRRNASTNQVTIKASRIERLVDPLALGGPDDDTEPLGEGKAVKSVVEDLLGLDFNQFTKCVALPQGDVAEFLHASAAERQKILTKLLGLEVYTKIQQAANARAAEQNTRAETLEGNIASSGVADPGQLLAAQQRVEDLDKLKTRVETQLSALTSTAQTIAADVLEQQRLQDAHAALIAVGVPDDVAEIEQRRTTAAAALADAKTQQDATERRETTAREALEAAPQRGALERLAQLHQQQTEAQAAIGGLEQAHTDAQQAVELALTAQQDVAAAVTDAANAAATAASKAQQAEALATTAQQQIDLLSEVEEPLGLQELHVQRSALTAAKLVAQEELDKAGAALTEAQERRAATHDPVDLERARVALEDVLGSSAQLAQARIDAAAAQAASAADADELTAAEATRAVAEAALDHARATDSALALREHLSVGDACPVCEQTVATLPPTGSAEDLTACVTAVEAAKTAEQAARARAQGSHTKATVTAQAVTTGVTQLVADRASAAHALHLLDETWTLPEADTSDEAGLGALDAQAGDHQVVLHRGIDEASQGNAACLAAERRRTAAEEAVRGQQQETVRLEEALSAERGVLRRRCDELLPLGRPAIDTDDPVVGWQALTSWSQQQLEERTPSLTALTIAAADAQEAAEAAAAHHVLLQASESTSTAAHQKAIAAEAAARTQLDAGQALLVQLVEAVADQDSAEQVAAALAALSLVEQEARAATGDRVEKRAATEAAQLALTDLDGEVRSARSAWSSSRDGLMPFGTPPAEQESLAESWSALATWAAAEAAVRATALNKHGTRVAKTRTAFERDQEQVRADCAAHGVTGPDTPVTSWALAELAGAQARAAGAVAAIEEEQRRNVELQRQADEARVRAQIASTLGNLLRADNLPRWLASNALDVLVAEASDTLRDLSGGQFELTSDDSGFQVIDRHDTDSIRGVKTLSGGETFQAALALALALSSQLGTLTASAAAQLEAIFIDEGFGTLDESTLEVVASTLEELAASGGRMVGVITHVPALAARVPVRFKVRRDASGSHVEREQQ